MPIYASKTIIDPVPEGLWPAVCCDVVDMGIVDWGFGPQVKIKICWQLEEINPKTGKRYLVSQAYTPSLHEKSKLRPILESWRGKKFTKDELKKFDIEKLIGACCQLSITHNIKDGGETYANVQAAVPPARNAGKIYVEDDYVRFKDRPDYKAPNSDLAEEPEPRQRQVEPEIEDEDIPF